MIPCVFRDFRAMCAIVGFHYTSTVQSIEFLSNPYKHMNMYYAFTACSRLLLRRHSLFDIHARSHIAIVLCLMNVVHMPAKRYSSRWECIFQAGFDPHVWNCFNFFRKARLKAFGIEMLWLTNFICEFNWNVWAKYFSLTSCSFQDFFIIYCQYISWKTAQVIISQYITNMC